MSALPFDAETHTYKLRGAVIPSVTQVLSQIIDYARVPEDILERKREIGAALHQAIAFDHDGDLDESSLDESVKGYFDGWRRFRFDMRGQFLVHAAEVPMVSYLYRYGTTPDIWGTVGGVPAVVELKSTAAIHPAVALQTAAQAKALIESKYIDFRLEKEVRRFCLQLKPSGKYSVKEFPGYGDLGVFIALRSVWGWRQNNKC